MTSPNFDPPFVPTPKWDIRPDAYVVEVDPIMIGYRWTVYRNGGNPYDPVASESIAGWSLTSRGANKQADAAIAWFKSKHNRPSLVVK